MKKSTAFLAAVAVLAGLAVVDQAALLMNHAHAADLDWGGQFRVENHWVNRYSLDSGATSRDAARETADGYYIPSAGKSKTSFQPLFLRLQPKLIVNDNVVLKTEWWLGNPSSSFFGSAGLGGSSTNVQGRFNDNTSSGSNITAQRFWAEVLSDFGTIVVGRAPFHWGLGLVHHSGDGLWDRFQTTGDTIRLNAKFGNFTFSPASTKYITGEVVGGTWNGAGTGITRSPVGGESLYEFSLGLKYENTDEELEGGVNLVRRLAGAQSSTKWINDTAGSLNYSIWDIYAKKKLGKFDFAVEAPIYSGNAIGIPYKAFAVAGELNYHANEMWTFGLKGGRVPGQPNSANNTSTKWNMVYFNPNYKMGLIMWNYQLRNFAGVERPSAPAAGNDSSANIFDNPITNANYINASAELRANKWRFGTQFVMASADTTAEQGRNYFNQWWKSYSDTAAVKSQDASYGKEIDLSINMDWDEFTTFGVDTGFFFPGKFFAFSDTTGDNQTDTVMAIVARLGIRF